MKQLSDDEFYEALNSEDHLGMVVRAHIHIEYWAERFLLAAMPQYEKYMKDIDANYELKILLCCAMGLSPELKAPLLLAGTLRNRFAHRPNYKLSLSDVNGLYAALSGTHQQHVKKAYKAMADQFGHEEKAFSKLPPVTRLNLLFMSIRSKLKKAHVQLQNTTSHCP